MQVRILNWIDDAKALVQKYDLQGVIIGIAIGVLATIGYYEWRNPSTRDECLEKLALQARSDSALRVAMGVCNRRFSS